MELISAARIKGFRSIADLELNEFGNFNVLCGLNNSGKSNVLRAIYAYFTDNCEPGIPLEIDRDFHLPHAKKHRKKQISVSVKFNIPGNFSFRKGLEEVKHLIASGTTITKVWERASINTQYYINNSTKPLDYENSQRIEQFLSLIPIRYVPNRVLPIDVIQQQHSALRDALVRRLGKKAPRPTELFGAIEETSNTLLEPMSKHVKDLCPGIEGVQLKTPDNWANIVFALGYRLKDLGIDVDDIFQGSGIQSLLMFETLALIDRDYFQQFGWRQAAVWLAEEPESSLHTSLEAHLASYLSEIASEQGGRLQIFATTHSDMIIQHADSAAFLEKGTSGTNLNPERDKRAIIDLSASAGVSRWTHPLLFCPLDPLILVEGKFDAAYLNEALALIKPQRCIRIQYLAQMDEEEDAGGVDALYAYLKSNKSALRARNIASPVIILLDWDVASKKAQFEKLFSKHDPCKVCVWPDSAFNPKLGRSFRGIERHYSDRMISEAEKLGVTVARDADGVGVIEKENYGSFKKKCNEVVRKGLRPSDFNLTRTFILELWHLAQA